MADLPQDAGRQGVTARSFKRRAHMKYVLIIAAVLTTIPLMLVATTSSTSAKRPQDYPNYGYCPGSNRRVLDISKCRAPGPNSGACPPGTYTKFGGSWAYDRRKCRSPTVMR